MWTRGRFSWLPNVSASISRIVARDCGSWRHRLFITDQTYSLFLSLWRAQVTNIVFMGMGEPLDNYEQVLAAIRAMCDPHRFGLAPSRVTVSTVGVVSSIQRLVADAPKVRLALSLHAPTQVPKRNTVAHPLSLPNVLSPSSPPPSLPFFSVQLFSPISLSLSSAPCCFS